MVVAAPAVAQHEAGASAPALHTFRVDGLRVDEAAPPPGSAVGRAGARFSDGGYLHVTHGKPYKRGRTIFGGLVAYDQVWVTGAHITTELATTVPITVGGQPLDPGVYSLFTTPGTDQWMLHLNTVLGTHLTDNYDPDRNVVTVEAPPARLDTVVQALEIEFVPTGEEAVDLVIRWDQTAVQFPIRRR
jgi:hypothetical protein